MELLRVRIPPGARSAKNYQLDDFPRFIRDPSSAAVVKGQSQDLSLLATKANPVYRPIVVEYQQIAALLARGRTKGIPERLARLKVLREGIADRMRSIDDYMNWFEATQSSKRSGTFAEYFKAAEQARESEPRRRDPISVYLDALETQFQD